MSKEQSTSGISILVQLGAWRSDDTFRPVDERIALTAGAMTIFELIRAKRIVGLEDRGVFALEVVDTTPTGEFILDGVLFWLEQGYKQTAISFIRETAETALLRTQTSLLAQNVLIDIEGDLIILGPHQDLLRTSIRKRLFGGSEMHYAHEILFSTLASVYNPNGALILSLLGIGYDQTIMEDLFSRRSPISDMEPSVKEAGNMLMAALYEATKTS